MLGFRQRPPLTKSSRRMKTAMRQPFLLHPSKHKAARNLILISQSSPKVSLNTQYISSKMCRDLLTTTHLPCSHQTFHTTHCSLGLDCPSPSRLISQLSRTSKRLCPDCRGFPRGRVKTKLGPDELLPPPSIKGWWYDCLIWIGICIVIFVIAVVVTFVLDFFKLTLEGKGPMREGFIAKLFTKELTQNDWLKVQLWLGTVISCWVFTFLNTVCKKLLFEPLGWFSYWVLSKAAARMKLSEDMG